VGFAWDPVKARRNLAKHGITFEDAKTVFDDDLYLSFADPDHSVEEHRFSTMGESKKASAGGCLHREGGCHSNRQCSEGDPERAKGL
jgi:uncharacterized DUF497 family protein